ncbi:MAG: sigma 54-interacting transcriptional regulator [Lentisphaerae bacterium]|nr:sigma 54-interacting transcriptional regulator [Lentisphaerota bacterium]
MNETENTRIAAENEFFREVTLRIGSSLDISEALQNLFDYISDYFPVDHLGLHRLEMEENALFAVAAVSKAGVTKIFTENYPMVTIDDELMELIKESVETPATVTVHNNPEKLPKAVARCFPELAGRSVITLHLSIKNENIGGLSLFSEGSDRYTELHVKLLELVKEPVALAMSNAWRFRELERLRDRLAEDNRALSMEMERASGAQVIGAEFGLAQVMEMVRRVAPLSSPVLLLGETGVGKEVIANSIRLLSSRNQGPMVRVNCGAIPETLLDSELFGHEKGAFTGAIERKRGRFERADGGTIFLDEIGELSADAQVRLLRVLQEKQFERVGGTKTLSADVRVIAATHRDLAQMVQKGRFREDLWYRLNVFPIRIPPLRLRRGDIPPLIHYFLERKARELNLEKTPAILSEDINRLQAYDWPGNVRELQNVIERALILSRGETLHFPSVDLPKSIEAPQQSTPLTASVQKTLDEATADYILATLENTDGKIAGKGGAAELLQVKPSTLRSKMQRLGIRIDRSAGVVPPDV